MSLLCVGECHHKIAAILAYEKDSNAFQASFSKARLKKYRESLLRLPIMDNVKPCDKEILSMDSKIAFLEPQKDMDDIIDAFAKVARNVDKLT